VYTIVETPVYLHQAAELLEEDERESIAAYLALNPNAGSVIRNSGGIRKLRWRTAQGGKRGGYRVIYFNRLGRGQVWLLTVFSKRQHENISTRELAKAKRAIDDED
jgi:hypothetical protein